MDSRMTPGSEPIRGRRFDRPIRFLRARFSPEGYLGLHLTIGLFVLLCAGWWFGDIAEDVSRNAATRILDEKITAWFQEHATPSLTAFFRTATFFGSVTFLTVATVTAAFLLALKRWRYRLLTLVLVTGGGSLLNLLLKHFFHRQRPVLENPLVTLSSYGFPSGHTMGSTIFYGSLALVLGYSTRTWRWRLLMAALAGGVVVAVGTSRIYLGAHYFTDVVGAIAISLAWLAFVWTGVETLRKWRGARRPP
jgi:membrane-associated phospholipid phosphatase